MKTMQSGTDEQCPFQFNFDARQFRVGDTVSYRVESLGEFPFVGVLAEVHDDHVVIASLDPQESHRRMRGTRESRPRVSRASALD